MLSFDEIMNKGQGKNRQSHLCLLVSLSAFIWLSLLYFHFVVLGARTDSIDDSSQLNPVFCVTRLVNTLPSNATLTSIANAKVEDGKKREKTVNRVKKDSRSHERQAYPFMRALRTVENKSDPCGGRYIYVHDLPPRFNEEMLKECKSLSLWTNMCKFTTNAGLGPPLENVEGVFSETGWYATNQFAVDVIFNNRMKQLLGI